MEEPHRIDSNPPYGWVLVAGAAWRMLARWLDARRAARTKPGRWMAFR
ncbi:hypothetical protein [Phenylobacterium deserti]|nr:hypothetical protein [Phenylobacterium deserti]